MALINLEQVKKILNVTTPFEIPNLKRLGLLKTTKVDGVEMFDEDQVREIAKEEEAKRERLVQMRAAAGKGKGI
jgi:hypothetical protein